MTSRVAPALAAQVRIRGAGRCEYCRAPQLGQTLHIDHIVPRFLGGPSTSENLCLACSHCNIAKGSRTSGLDPRTRKVVRLFNPRADSWEGHFRWSNDWSRLIGKTSVGRATVVCLDVNAKILREARPSWLILGLIP